MNIAFEKVSIRLGDRLILEDLNFEIAAKEKCFVIGPSGIGKSVLLRLIVKLLEPTQGKVLIDGKDLALLSPKELLQHRRKCGYIFQKPTLLDTHTLLENLLLAGGKEVNCKELLHKVGLEPTLLPLYPSELSYGTKKRAAIARSLATDPEYLLFDEPTTGLDPIAAREIHVLIREIPFGALTVSHDLPLANAFADRILAFQPDLDRVTRKLESHFPNRQKPSDKITLGLFQTSSEPLQNEVKVDNPPLHFRKALKSDVLQWLLKLFNNVGKLAEFLRLILNSRHTLVTLNPGNRGLVAEVSEQIVKITRTATLTVMIAGLFVGGILVLQFLAMLGKFDAQILLGGLTSSSIVRQVGPLIISFLLAGKVGAYTAAEIATLRVTDQIDALECLGVNPIRVLIFPRWMATVIAGALLLLFGLFASMFGALVIASTLGGLNNLQFLSTIPRFTTTWTFIGGFIHAVIYGVIIGTVSCFYGFHARLGAAGVGHAVNQSAMFTNLLIVVANFVTSCFLGIVQNIWGFR